MPNEQKWRLLKADGSAPDQTTEKEMQKTLASYSVDELSAYISLVLSQCTGMNTKRRLRTSGLMLALAEQAKRLKEKEENKKDE